MLLVIVSALMKVYHYRKGELEALEIQPREKFNSTELLRLVRKESNAAQKALCELLHSWYGAKIIKNAVLGAIFNQKFLNGTSHDSLKCAYEWE